MKCCEKTRFCLCLTKVHFPRKLSIFIVLLACKVNFHCAPGMQSEFFNLLKLKLSVEDYWESQSIIMFDEMQMCQIYEYCPRLKQMFPAHKKVQVVLLR